MGQHAMSAGQGIMTEALCSVHAKAASRHWWFVGRRHILSTLLKALVCPDAQRLVVEVGCGTGENLAWLSQSYDVLAVEPSSPAAVLARQRVSASRVIETDTPHDVPEYSRADAVLMLDVLEHVADDRAFLSRWVEPMKPGSILLITVPADPALWSRHDEAYGHYRRYERDGLRGLLYEQPVELLLLSYCNARLYWCIRLARCAARRMGRSWGPHGTDLWMPPTWLNGLLAKVFSSEAQRLLWCLKQGSGGSAWPRGVSLVAAARRSG
jgi:SAM-dependent methyltransferase